MSKSNQNIHPPPPPPPSGLSFKRKRTKQETDDQNVDCKIPEVKLFKKEANSWEIESTDYPLSPSLLSPESCIEQTEDDTETVILPGFSDNLELSGSIRPPSPSIIEVAVPPKPPPEIIDLFNMEYLFRPPSPSVIEVAVPPKPPPEVIDLLHEDDVPIDRNMNRRASKDILEQTLSEYKQLYPRQNIPDVNSIRQFCQGILLDAKLHTNHFGSIPLDVMVINYYKHMKKNQDKLSSSISRIIANKKHPNAAWSCWYVRNKVNTHLESYLGLVSSSGSLKTASLVVDKPVVCSWHQIKTALAAQETQLQPLLVESFSLPPQIIKLTNTFQVDQWSPHNLTMPFQLFVFTVTGIKDNHTLSLEHVRIYKKQYVEYMHNVAESNHEFFLAVVSTFGICLRSYPGRILHLFQGRNMLRANCRTKQAPSQAVATNDDSIISKGNEILARCLEASKSFLEREFQYSLKQFANLAHQISREFHGKQKTLPTICEWYDKMEILSGFEINKAITMLNDDNHRSEIPCVKTMTYDELTRVKNIVHPELKARRRKHSLSGKESIQQIMESETSILQLYLAPTKNNRNVPRPDRWSPFNGFFPFPLFKAIFELQFKSRTEQFKLHENALKVRYMEITHHYFKSRKDQILLAVFSAFGPNLGQLPLRVLQILQETKLLRTDLGFPKCRGPNSNANPVFAPLDQNFRESRTGVTEPAPRRYETSNSANGNQVRKSVSAYQTAESPTRNIPTSVQNRRISSVPLTTPPASPVVKKFLEWRQSGGEVLNTLGIPELSDSGYEATFSRHTAYCQSREGLRNSEFRKGMLAGASLATKSYQEQHQWPNIASTATSNMNSNTGQPYSNNLQRNRAAATSTLNTPTTFSKTKQYFNQPQQEQSGLIHNMQGASQSQNYAVAYVPCYYLSGQHPNTLIQPNPPLPLLRPPPLPLLPKSH